MVPMLSAYASREAHGIQLHLIGFRDTWSSRRHCGPKVWQSGKNKKVARPVSQTQNKKSRSQPTRLTVPPANTPRHTNRFDTTRRLPSASPKRPTGFVIIFSPASHQPHTKTMDSYETAAPQQGGRACYNCGDASHLSRDCPQKGTPTCYNCGGQGHLSRECTEPTKDKACYSCGETGHMSRECPNGGGQQRGGFGGGASGGQECYKCGKVGHIARNCTQGGYGQQGGFGGGYGGGYGGRQGGGGGQQTCYTCGGYGHMSRDCTQGQKCYNCGEVGHLSRECPSEASGERTCYRCKQPGHVQSQCPN